MSEMETILVTESEFKKAEQVFRAATDLNCEPVAPDETSLTTAVVERSVRAVIVGVAPYRGALYEVLGKRNGAIIARFGVGHDNINKPLARQHGIIVTNTPGVLDVSVAEHALWLMGCLARRISRLETRLRAGEFAADAGVELRGKTLGILGFGAIGRRVAAIAHFGFGMKMIACDCIPAAQLGQALSASGAERYTNDVEEMFRAADIVSIHLPANASTQRFINAERLAWLKPGAMLVNTARGAVLDEEALYEVLVSGRIAGAALDVFEAEPYRPMRPDKDLRKLENVVLTPHIGSNTREANQRMGEASLVNVRAFLAGRLNQLSRVDGA